MFGQKKKGKGNPVTRSDAEHYIAANNSPIDLKRERSGKPLVMVPQAGSDLEKELGKGTVLHFWGFEKVVAVVDLWKEENNGKP